MARLYPPMRALFWVPPTADGRACYVVEFEDKLAGGEAGAFGVALEGCPDLHSVVENDDPQQVTVLFKGLDQDCAGLNWLKEAFWPVVRGTVAVDLYVETMPLTARLRTLGEVTFDVDDLARIAGLPGIASTKFVRTQVEVEFDPGFAETADVTELGAVFTQQHYFAATVIPVLGTPPAA